MLVTAKSGDLRIVTLKKNEMECLESRVMVEEEDINAIKEVALPRGQFREGAVMVWCQNVR